MEQKLLRTPEDHAALLAEFKAERINPNGLERAPRSYPALAVWYEDERVDSMLYRAYARGQIVYPDDFG